MGGDIEFRQTVPGEGGTANCSRKMSMPYAQKSTVSRVTVVFQRCKESERDPSNQRRDGWIICLSAFVKEL